MSKISTILALVGALLITPATQAAHVNYLFDFVLDGDNNVAPGAGDPDGMGSGTVLLDAAGGWIEWAFSFENVAPIMAGHIHNGPVDGTGPVVYPFEPFSSGSAMIDTSLAANIVADPAAYYVNFHNPDFPPGAVRAQFSEPELVARDVPDSLGSFSALLALGLALAAGRRFRRAA